MEVLPIPITEQNNRKLEFMYDVLGDNSGVDYFKLEKVWFKALRHSEREQRLVLDIILRHVNSGTELDTIILGLNLDIQKIGDRYVSRFLREKYYSVPTSNSQSSSTNSEYIQLPGGY